MPWMEEVTMPSMNITMPNTAAHSRFFIRPMSRNWETICSRDSTAAADSRKNTAARSR